MTDPQPMIDAYLDDDLSPQDAAALTAWLKADPANVDALVRQAHLHWQLREALSGKARLECIRHTPCAAGSNGTRSVPDTFRSLAWTGAIAAAVLLLGVTVLWLYRTADRGNVLQPPEPTAVATLTGSFEAVWAGETKHPAGQPLMPGRMDLRSGLVEIAFQGGASVIVEGPATVELQTAQAGRLVQGTLTARVPPRAKGFRIDMPAASVVDLGTQFGLVVADSGQTAVHVLQGRVEIGRGESDREPVEAGHAVRAERTGGRLVPIVFQPQRFVESLDGGPRRVAAPAARRVLVVVAHEDFDYSDFEAVRRELERAGVRVVVASSARTPAQPDPKTPGEPVTPDLLLGDAKATDFDAVVFTGGQGIREFLLRRPAAIQAGQLIDAMIAAGKCVGALDMGPAILADAGVLAGKRATGHRWIRGKLEGHGATWAEGPVVVEGQFVTGSDAESAAAFVGELLRRAAANTKSTP